MKMEKLDEDTLEEIRYNAEFVESVINKALGKEVGYSSEGVAWLDDFLQRQHERGDKSYADRVVGVYGSYLGQCIRTVGRTATRYWATTTAFLSCSSAPPSLQSRT